MGVSNVCDVKRATSAVIGSLAASRPVVARSKFLSITILAAMMQFAAPSTATVVYNESFDANRLFTDLSDTGNATTYQVANVGGTDYLRYGSSTQGNALMGRLSMLSAGVVPAGVDSTVAFSIAGRRNTPDFDLFFHLWDGLNNVRLGIGNPGSQATFGAAVVSSQMTNLSTLTETNKTTVYDGPNTIQGAGFLWSWDATLTNTVAGSTLQGSVTFGTSTNSFNVNLTNSFDLSTGLSFLLRNNSLNELYDVSSFSATITADVPEPMTGSLILAGLVGMLFGSRRRRGQKSNGRISLL